MSLCGGQVVRRHRPERRERRPRPHRLVAGLASLLRQQGRVHNRREVPGVQRSPGCAEPHLPERCRLAQRLGPGHQLGGQAPDLLRATRLRQCVQPAQGHGGRELGGVVHGDQCGGVLKRLLGTARRTDGDGARGERHPGPRGSGGPSDTFG